MTVIYRCDFCKKEFKNLEECIQHEQHAHNNCAIKETLVAANKVCDYCDNSYYVYGCERACQFETKCNRSNKYFYFQLADPYHDKSIAGV